ncbi:HSPB1-associated protein 1 homolog [Glandiceps talaboti]
MATKPISAEMANKLVMDVLPQPVVFHGMIDDWPARSWTVQSLSDVLEDQKLTFRIGPKQCRQQGVLWERDCCYRDATLQQFSDWLRSEDTGVSAGNPLNEFSLTEYWCYADYKYMAHVFKDNTDVLKSVRWDDFGFHGRDGTQSTIWIGSSGSHTPCHYDTYGCNLVVQVYGQKTWHLFPPHQTSMLYPTRIPYEESSVFSQVNILSPDLLSFPKFQDATPYIVTLEPGDVLFVPTHWWHFVECDTTAVSINTWIELDIDNDTRVEEAITRTITCNLLSQIKDQDGKYPWLNPTEDFTNSETNLQYMKAAIRKACEKGIVGRHTQGDGKKESIVGRNFQGDSKKNKNKPEFAETLKTDCDGHVHKKLKTSELDETFDSHQDIKTLDATRLGDEKLLQDLMRRQIVQEIKCMPSIRQQAEEQSQTDENVKNLNDQKPKIRTKDDTELCIKDPSYEMIVECLTHPSVVKQVAELMKDKCLQNKPENEGR